MFWWASREVGSRNNKVSVAARVMGRIRGILGKDVNGSDHSMQARYDGVALPSPCGCRAATVVLLFASCVHAPRG